MRLISCYVENFGTIHKFSYEFAEGLNIINEMNGWGKTTFAVFIKAMFYGMESTTKRNIEENERRKYMPWNGGKYGGYIVFRLGNRKYRVERFFGNKEREDYFNLYDEDTKLESDDFTDKLGEEIFKIDREAFARSTFVPQQQIKVKVNDSLSAKLTNMIESDNDINNYELAIGRLDEAIKAYRKKGDKGRIAELESELRYAQSELDDCLSKEEPYEQWKKMLSDKQDNKIELESRLDYLDKSIEVAGSIAELNAKQEHFDELNQEVAKKQEEMFEIERFFNNEIPSYEIVNEYEVIAEKLVKYKFNMKQNLVCDADRDEYNQLVALFKDGIPQDGELDDCEESVRNVLKFDSAMKAYKLTNEEVNEYAKLENRFRGMLDMNETLEKMKNKYSRYTELGTELDKNRNELKTLETMYDINSGKTLELNKGVKLQRGLFVGGIVLVILGIFLAIKFSITSGTGFIGIGALVVLGSYIWGRYNEGQTQKNEKICDKNYEEIMTCNKTIELIASERKEIGEELKSFLVQYTGKTEIRDMLNTIAEVSLAHKSYLSLKHKKIVNDEEIWAIQKKKEAEISYINSILARFYPAFCHEEEIIEDQDKKWREIIKGVRDKKKDYIALNTKITSYDKSMNELAGVEPQVVEFISQYYDDINDESYDKKVHNIKVNLDNFYRVKKELENAIAKLDAFKAKNNKISPDGMIMQEDIPLERLQEERKRVVEKISAVREEYDNIKVKCSEFTEVISRKPEFETEVDRIKEELQEATRKHDLLSNTKMFLENAKEQFSGRYLTNLNKSFNRYITMLNGSNMGNTEMDTMLNINFEAYGSKKELDYMSTGYKDLFSFCTRLALVDAMFVDEHPFLILDDPFVNLDKDKIENALELIREVSMEYQVIYFVCHSSRV